MVKDDTTTLQVCLRRDVYNLVRDAAKKADRPVSVFVRELLEAHLKLPKFESRRD
jgi:hypothetical protein